MTKKRLLNIVGSIVALLALVGVAVILALTLSQQTTSPEPTVTLAAWEPSPSSTPTEARKAASPTATATPGSAFDSPVKTPTPGKPTPTVPVPDLDDYVFGEPKVVLTHTTAIGIARWLPDGERLLLVRLDPDRTTREYVETFNVHSGELRRYGERHSVPVKPVWLDKLGKVAFADVSERQYSLWISSYGQEQAREAVFSGVEFPMAGGGDTVLVVPRKQRQITAVDEGGKARSGQAIDLSAYGFRPDDVLTYFRMAISPDEERLAAYDREHLVIWDLKTGVGQAFDLGVRSEYEPDKIWAFHAEWSPDGCYLAMITTAGSLPMRFTDLTILDTVSGERQRVDLGSRYVTEVAWAPNGSHLTVWAVVVQREGVSWAGLYLVDVSTGKTRRILPDDLFGGSMDWTWNLAWSPEGDTIATTCPGGRGPRLCLIPVTVRQ
jgi:WD40 repeat protein